MKSMLIGLLLSGLFCVADTKAEQAVSEVQVIWAMGSNNVITNWDLLGMAGILVKLEQEEEREKAHQTALQVEKTMTSCRAIFLAYAEQNGIAEQKTVTKLLGGYAVLIAHARAMREFIEEPNAEREAIYVEKVNEAWHLIDTEFFGTEDSQPLIESP